MAGIMSGLGLSAMGGAASGAAGGAAGSGLLSGLLGGVGQAGAGGAGGSGLLSGLMNMLKGSKFGMQRGGTSFSIGQGQAGQEREQLLAALMQILQAPRAMGRGEANVLRIGGHPSTPMGTGFNPSTPAGGGFNLDQPMSLSGFFR